MTDEEKRTGEEPPEKPADDYTPSWAPFYDEEDDDAKATDPGRPRPVFQPPVPPATSLPGGYPPPAPVAPQPPPAVPQPSPPAYPPVQPHDPALWLRRTDSPPGTAPPAPPGNYIGAPPAHQAWPTPVYAPQPDNGKATAALVLGIVGLVIWLTGLGFAFFINIPCSVLAWVYGVQGRRRVERGETTKGEGSAKAGVIMGILGTIVGVLSIAAWVLIIVLAE